MGPRCISQKLLPQQRINIARVALRWSVAGNPSAKNELASAQGTTNRLMVRAEKPAEQPVTNAVGRAQRHQQHLEGQELIAFLHDNINEDGVLRAKGI